MTTPCQQSQTPDWWFASPGTEKCLAAKQICFQQCPIQAQCAEYALTEGIPFGVFGGEDERDRARLWKRMDGGKPQTFTRQVEKMIHLGLSYRRDHEKGSAA